MRWYEVRSSQDETGWRRAMGEYDGLPKPHVTSGDWLPFEREHLDRVVNGQELPWSFYEARNLNALGYRAPKEWGWPS